MVVLLNKTIINKLIQVLILSSKNVEAKEYV